MDYSIDPGGKPMSRYAIFTENEDLEILLGFDEGLRAFFLTIEDVTKSTGEPESFLFHNMVHHPGVGMTYEDLERAFVAFGIHLPADLATSLAKDAGEKSARTLKPQSVGAIGTAVAEVQVIQWQRID